MMRLKITSWNGVEWMGILLSSAGLSMRVAVVGCDDATEFHYRGGQWFAENGDLAQIEFDDPGLDLDLECIFPFDETADDQRPAPAWLN